MILPITDKFRVVTDRCNWTVQEKKVGKKNGDAQWRVVGHYVDLSHAITELAQYCLRTSEAQSLAEAFVEFAKITQQLTAALSTEYEVTKK